VTASGARTFALTTLGCARNEVDSEELAGRLAASGWHLVDEEAADVVLVNTCGFVEAAKKESVDALLQAADSGRRVVAVGCLAERYGVTLADALPEADAVLGFDDYADIGARLEDVLAGRRRPAHLPQDRRRLLPVTPAHRPAAAAEVALPGHAWLPSRRRLSDGPVANLKLASGCDRRCSFCAIPSFRGAFVSRPPDDVLAGARWLAEHGARELILVSENSTSYGKDLGDLTALERLLPRLAMVDGVDRVRVSYLQPAELRPGLIEAVAGTAGVAPYFDLSFQHSSQSVLRRMRRFGGTEDFLGLLARIRSMAPAAGVRSNIIIGFPGEDEDDVAELAAFLGAARLDAVGVFGYSDEDGTEAVGLDGHLGQAEVDARVEYLTAIADEVMAQRAEERVGEQLRVLIEEKGDPSTGRALHQGPEDGDVSVAGRHPAGSVVSAVTVDSVGVDLVATPRERS
jgi:ribosomal protein S12 methylthiotransferase RimO